MNTTTDPQNPTPPTHPTQQYASTTTAPTEDPTQEQGKPNSSINTLVPLDIEYDPVGFRTGNSPNHRNRNRNKPREFGLKALRNHLFVAILRYVLALLSLSVLAYVDWLSKQWVEEKKAADDDGGYVLGFVGPSVATAIDLLIILLVFVGLYSSGSGNGNEGIGAAVGFSGDLIVVGINMWAFVVVAPWRWSVSDSHLADAGERPWKDAEAVAAWLCVTVAGEKEGTKEEGKTKVANEWLD